MKNTMLSSLFLILISSGITTAQTPYPQEVPGDAGYEIIAGGGGINNNDIDFTSFDQDFSKPWAFLPECDQLSASFKFTYPNMDPAGKRRTRMKFDIYEKNWIGGAFTEVISSPVWVEDPPSVQETYTFNSALKGITIDIQPFHLYYIEVRTQKQSCFFGLCYWNIVFRRLGNTQSVNIAPCANRCRSHPGFNWVLGDLSSSPVNQAAGLYNPLYETDNSIESTTHLNPDEQLILDAGESIKLLPGFKAEHGSDFIAYIDGCGGRTS